VPLINSYLLSSNHNEIIQNDLKNICITLLGVRGGVVGWWTALQAGRSWVLFPMVSLEFFIDIILLAALWSCEMSTRNISWEVKAAGAYGWQTYHLHVPTVMKSGNLNLLEASGPVQACNGIAFIHYTIKTVVKWIHLLLSVHQSRQNITLKRLSLHTEVFIISWWHSFQKGNEICPLMFVLYLRTYRSVMLFAEHNTYPRARVSYHYSEHYWGFDFTPVHEQWDDNNWPAYINKDTVVH
jgi:hypothetical protein